MEYLFNLCLSSPISERSSRALALSWSRDNLLCVASSSVKGDVLSSELHSNKLVCEVNVIDPNRPWTLHNVIADSSEMVYTVEWSTDGKCLMIVTECGNISLWTRRDNCLNTWEKIYNTEISGTIITANWIGTSLQVTINYGRNNWEELLTKHQCSHDLQKVIDSGIAIVTAERKLYILTIQVKQSTPDVVELVDTTTTNSLICSADFNTKSNGTLLCAVGYNDGSVRIFSVKLRVRRFGRLQFDCEVVAKIDHTERTAVRQMKLVPFQLSGFNLHLLRGNITMEQWLLGDLCSSLNTEPKKLVSYNSQAPVAMFSLTSLCFGSCDSMSSHDDDVIVLDDEVQRFMELIVIVTKYNTIACLKRDNYVHLCENINIPMEDQLGPPGMKQLRMDGGKVTTDQLVCLSPNGCCVAVGVRESIHFFNTGYLLTNKANANNLFVLFLMAVVCDQLPWDLAITCAISSSTDSANVLGMLYQLSHSYSKQEPHVQCRYLTQYCTARSILYSCLDDGIHPAMELHNVVRLHAVYNLLSLYMIHDSSKGHYCELLKSTCESNKTESNLQIVYQLMQVKELLPPAVVQRLQPHLLWTLEYAVRITGRLAKKDLQKVPDSPCLVVLRELLVILHSVNNVVMLPQVHNISDLVGLLFKAITLYCQSPPGFISFPESLLAELSELPSETNSNQLTLSKAAFLQGFLCGLNDKSCLPHTYYNGSPPSIRHHVLKKQFINDPYSPLALVVPKNLSPPWQDRLYEGQGDCLHFGATITSKQLQAARQCSRCRHWASFSEALDHSAALPLTAQDMPMDIAKTWDNMWDQCCPCGGLWCQYYND